MTFQSTGSMAGSSHMMTLDPNQLADLELALASNGSTPISAAGFEIANEGSLIETPPMAATTSVIVRSGSNPIRNSSTNTVVPDYQANVDELWTNIDGMNFDVEKSGLETLLEKSGGLDAFIEESGISHLIDMVSEDDSNASYAVAGLPDEPSTDDLIENVESFLKSVSGGVATNVDDETMDEAHQQAISDSAQGLINALMESKQSVIVPARRLDAPSPARIEEIVDEDVIPVSFSGTGAPAAPTFPAVKAEKFMKEEDGNPADRIYSQPQQHTALKPAPAVDAGQSSSNILSAMVVGSVVQDAGLSISADELKDATTTTVVGSNGEQIIIIITKPPNASTQENSNMDMSGVVGSSPRHQQWTLDSDEIMTTDSKYNTTADAFFSSINDKENHDIVSLSLLEAAMSPGAASTIAATASVADEDDRSSTPFFGSDAGDSDWLPSPGDAGAGGKAERKKYQRKNPRVPQYLSEPYPTDKSERKKAQNKTAAYRYRQKKLAEQEALDDEMKELEKKNELLKQKLDKIVTEMKCMKKLLHQTGLGHIAQAVKM